MLAIEGALHSLSQRSVTQIVREHRRPRDGLQHGPMRAGRRQQRDDQQDVAESGKHNWTFASWWTEVKDALQQSQITVANEREA